MKHCRVFKTASALRRAVVLMPLVVLLGGCTDHMLASAPPDPARPWHPSSAAASLAGAASEDGRKAMDFGVRPVPEVGMPQNSPEISPSKIYGLADLIDLAQKQNPQTRVAWQQARQAALAAGMAEATYLPFISANVVAGRQRVVNSLPLAIGNVDDATTTVSGVSPQIALQWLVFDFGQRRALNEAAINNANAANVLFNGEHQKIVYDVTRAYFVYGAARKRVRIAEQNLGNSQEIAAAAAAHVDKGLGTTVELAQARQGVAQARFGLVLSQGAERSAYQGLLAAMGVSPMVQLRVKDSGGRNLPADLGRPTETMIASALARRPDVLAAFSALKASRAAIKAAQAEFMPKIYLGAVAAGGDSNLSASGLPTIGQQSSSTGFVLGATMPIFDGGLRAAQIKNAQSLADATGASFEKIRDSAAREIVVSAETLRSALASYRAAQALTAASAVTYDAAVDSYSTGSGNITAATAADSGLLTARQGESEAYAASLVAAANLAFVLGRMTSADDASSVVR